MSDNHKMVKLVIITATKENPNFRFHMLTNGVYVILGNKVVLLQKKGEIEPETRNIELHS